MSEDLPRRAPLLERIVVERPRRADLLLGLLLAATAGAAVHLPAPLAVAPAVVAAVLAGAWCSPPVQLLLPLALSLALLTGSAGTPSSPQLAATGGVALAMGLAARLVSRSAAVATTSRTHALRTAVARDDEVRAAHQSTQELVGQLHYWSTHDALTGLLNRSALLRQVDAALAAGHPTGILVVSVAGFASVNDAHGDGFGDAALTQLAQRLVGTARSADVVGRLGGDSFGVVLVGMSAHDAPAVAARLVQPLEAPVVHETTEVTLRLRTGVAVVEAAGSVSGRTLLRTAEAAARRATAGQPPVVIAGQAPPPVDEGLTEADLARGLQAGELFLLYQPLVDGDSGRISSVEALVRWRHPVHGLVPPDAFIGLAERTGLIVPLGLKVLELACAQLSGWAATAPGLTVAVNVSARQLVEPGFVEEVRRVLWGSRVDPTRLVLELTESLLVDDSEAAVAVLWQLRTLGVRLALDDFGTGYSSLARLGEMPLDEMKIDKSFVDRLGALPRDSATLVTAAVAMGHGLGLAVVAEGVETAAQAAFLREVGCDLLQGYLLGKPQPAEAITPQLGRSLLPPVGAIPAPRPDDDRMVVPGVLPSLGPPSS